jgi:hypothetical protein
MAALAGAASACLGACGSRAETAGSSDRPLSFGRDFPALNQYVGGRPLICHMARSS